MKDVIECYAPKKCCTKNDVKKIREPEFIIKVGGKECVASYDILEKII